MTTAQPKPPKEKKKSGGQISDMKPTFDAAWTDILERVTRGESLYAIAHRLGIPESNCRKWISEDAKLAADYESARRDRAHYFADEIVEIADQALRGEISPQAARVAIDAKKWIASRLFPKAYGDKLQVGGAEDLPPIRQDMNISPDEAYRRMLDAKD